MLQDLMQTVIDSYVAPRRAARTIIDQVTDYTGVAVIFGLSFTLNAIILIFKMNASPESLGGDPNGGVFSLVIVNLIFSAVTFAVLAAIVMGVGRLFGGKGAMLDVMTALAWHNLVTVIFAPFLSFDALVSGDGGGLALQGVMMVFVVWLLINFVTEAHRFTNVWKVAAVMFGLLFIPAFLMSLAGLNTM